LPRRIVCSRINPAGQRDFNLPESPDQPTSTAIRPLSTSLFPFLQASANHSIPIGPASRGGSVQSVFSAPARPSTLSRSQCLCAPRRYAKNALHYVKYAFMRSDCVNTLTHFRSQPCPVPSRTWTAQTPKEETVLSAWNVSTKKKGQLAPPSSLPLIAKRLSSVSLERCSHWPRYHRSKKPTSFFRQQLRHPADY